MKLVRGNGTNSLYLNEQNVSGKRHKDIHSCGPRNQLFLDVDKYILLTLTERGYFSFVNER